LRSRRDEDGSAVVELVWVVILLLVPLLWIVLSVFEVQSGAYGVTSAARAAGRAYALAPNDAEGRAAATAAARQALVDQGLPADAPLSVTVSCTPYPSNCHSGTSVITVRVGSSVDLLVPDVLGGGRPSFALDATHTVPIGQYQEVDREVAP
jgi:Flp pilus assembly protein TadG